jgi:hypothetical protein
MKISISNYEYINFQNMADMHKGYAYQISNYVAYKTFTKVQPSLPKQNQHEQNQKQIIGEGIEPKFYEELCPIIIEVSCPTTPHTKPITISQN